MRSEDDPRVAIMAQMAAALLGHSLGKTLAPPDNPTLDAAAQIAWRLYDAVLAVSQRGEKRS